MDNTTMGSKWGGDSSSSEKTETRNRFTPQGKYVIVSLFSSPYK